MKTKFLLFLSAVILSFSGFAQGLYTTRENDLGDSFILELNKTTGDVIDNHVFSTTDYALGSLTYDAFTNEIYGFTGYRQDDIDIADPGDASTSDDVSGGKIIKYNITTKTETSFSLPDSPEMYHNYSIIIANGRLFATREDDSGNSFILELNKTTGDVIDSYVFSTTDYAPGSLTYDASTNEIYGVSGYRRDDDIADSGDASTNNDVFEVKIIKYNIATKTETSFSLPEMYYNYNIIIINGNTSGVDAILSNENSKPIRAFNLFGQEVPLNTTNQIIIIEYENGFREKAYRN